MINAITGLSRPSTRLIKSCLSLCFSVQKIAALSMAVDTYANHGRLFTLMVTGNLLPLTLAIPLGGLLAYRSRQAGGSPAGGCATPIRIHP